MLNSIARNLVEIPQRLNKPSVREFGLGLLAGTHAFLWLSWFVSTWGVSLPVVVALAVSVAAALLLAPGLDSFTAVQTPLSRAGASALLAGWTLALPGLLSLSPEMLRWTSLDTVQGPLAVFAIAMVAATLLVVPGWLVLLWTLRVTRSTRTGTLMPDSLVAPSALLGAASSLFLMPITVAVALDLRTISWTVSGIGLAIAVLMWIAHRRLATQPDAPGPGDPHSAIIRPAAGGGAWLFFIGDVWIGLMAGVALSIVVRITGQLVANSAYVSFSQLAGVVIGIAAGMVIRRRRQQQKTMFAGNALPVAESLLIAFGVVTPVVLFPQLMAAALQISANVSSTIGIFLLRGGMLVFAMLPMGLAIGLRFTGRSFADGQFNRTRMARSLAAVAVSFAAARAADFPVAAGMSVLVLGAGAAVAFSWNRQPEDRRERKRLALAAALLAPLAVGMLATSRYDASRSAKILFSSQAFLAYRAETPIDQLHMIDDGRLVESLDLDGATWTAWMYAGEQMLVRENGMPCGVTSLDPAVCPDIASEMLPAVLPMVLHPAPRDITLIGIGGGTPLSACLAFPVSHVTCIEPRQGLLAIAQQSGANGATPDLFKDSRLNVVRSEPVIAAAARQAPQDIIIINHAQPFLWDASAEFTSAYYRRLANRLAPGGLLCQRLFYGDFGEQPIRDVAATLRSIFPQVILVETGPGELVFLASRDTNLTLSPEILHRASRPHVRSLMSRLGSDWSVLLATASLDTEAIDEISDSESASANSVVRGRFAYQLPAEVARWGAKQQEVHELLGPLAQGFYGSFADEAGLQELSERLADVTELHRLIHEHPDVYWAYRDTLRARLQERPRLTIQQVGHDGLGRGLHPEDERRKEFLLALNDAATQSIPAPQALNRLNRFVEPYDPLVSYFAHHELANLYTRAEVSNANAELAHRLHTVFFAGGGDQSVRNVSKSIDLIIEQPQVLSDPRQRWDTLNGLLEVLMRRWQMRSVAEEPSRYEAADANDSFEAAQRALDAMEEMAPEGPISVEDWNIRRLLLEQHLIRPLRNHRSEQRT